MRAKNSKDDVNSAVMTTPTFVLELPVKLGQGELAEVRKRFNYARNLYNATVGTALGQLQQMRQGPQWLQAGSCLVNYSYVMGSSLKIPSSHSSKKVSEY